MKSSTRALRRHHIARLRDLRRRHFGGKLASDARRLGMAVTTAKPCSCWACGNQRRYFGPTQQEARLFVRQWDSE